MFMIKKLNRAMFAIIVYINADIKKLIRIKFCNFDISRRFIPSGKLEMSIGSSRVPIC